MHNTVCCVYRLWRRRTLICRTTRTTLYQHHGSLWNWSTSCRTTHRQVTAVHPRLWYCVWYHTTGKCSECTQKLTDSQLICCTEPTTKNVMRKDVRDTNWYSSEENVECNGLFTMLRVIGLNVALPRISTCFCILLLSHLSDFFLQL